MSKILIPFTFLFVIAKGTQVPYLKIRSLRIRLNADSVVLKWLSEDRRLYNAEEVV